MSLRLSSVLTLGVVASTVFGLAACGSDESSSKGGALSNGGSNIKHVVLLVQENHTFDNYFGTYCTAATGSSPTCVEGPACCESSPDTEPSGASPILLDDASNAARDPNHKEECELDQVNGGAMDRFVTGSSVSSCSDPRNFAIADAASVSYYRSLAAKYALADRYFQPIAGQSSANDMYFAVAKFVFADNGVEPDAIGKTCALNDQIGTYPGTTIADLLVAKGASFGVYAEGYDAMANAVAQGVCPDVPEECKLGVSFYPCVYDPSDIPFAYYPSLSDKPEHAHDLSKLAADAAAGTLPSFSFVKTIGYKSEHPGYGNKLSAGADAAKAIVDAVLAGPQANETLILITWDEGGGYFDHVSPPPTSTVDNKAYGTRVPMLAIGRFARSNVVSHVTLEHSSVVKFLELNFLGNTGQLNGRDTEVANLGSLLDPTQTGIVIPED